MAQIDVTELLCDPDFVDEISLITRKPSVNLYGELSVEETVTDSIGSVQPASGKVLQRLPEAMRLNDMSTFWFKGQIIASEPGKYASILVFKGKRYQVQSIQDWSNFGAGYTEGLCVAEVIAP
jgi:galactose-6-phosphate isomerase